MMKLFLSVNVNICFGCSKEPSHRDGSFEYPQHMFWLRNKKNSFKYVAISRGLFLEKNKKKQNSITLFYIFWGNFGRGSLRSYRLIDMVIVWQCFEFSNRTLV